MFGADLKREMLVKRDIIIANLRVKGEHWRVNRILKLKERIESG